MIPVERLLNNARVRCPGVLNDAMQIELYTVFDDFFRRSTVWREKIGLIIQENMSTYTIEPFAGQIVRMFGVHNLDDTAYRGGFMPAPGILKFVTLPNVGQNLLVDVMLTVEETDTTSNLPVVPPDLIAQHHAVLLDGLLARLMSQPNKPYTNLQLAALHNMNFRSGCSRARNEVTQSRVVGGAAWRFPSTFNRRG